jgi:putative PIN family toxin of toxin-antitoxin system
VLRAVYDTNIIVSGLLRKEGISAFLLDLATQGYVKLILSKDILEEYEEVLLRPKFSFSQKLIKRLLLKLRARGKVVKPKTTVAILKDPADNKFLECALSGKAKYLVTGNTRHFPFRAFRGIKVVSPREFWEIYKESLLASHK